MKWGGLAVMYYMLAGKRNAKREYCLSVLVPLALSLGISRDLTDLFNSINYLAYRLFHRIWNLESK